MKIGSFNSMPREVLSGVPQGSVLGPLLFLVYISDLPSGLESTVTSYADDTNCYCSPAMGCGRLQSDIDKIKNWSLDWQMPLNDAKCTVLHLGGTNPGHQYNIGTQRIASVTEQRDLGIVVSKDLKWEKHISSIVKKANSFTYMISRAFVNLSPDMILKIHKSFIRPKLEYAQSVWSPYYIKDIEALERVQRRVTRLSPELRPLPYEGRLERLGLTTLYQRRLRGDLIETYKIISGYYNSSLQIFTVSGSQHLRGHTKKLSKEKCSKLLRKNFISNRVVYSWNRLSEDTINSVSVNQFKNRLDLEMSEWHNTFIHYTL